MYWFIITDVIYSSRQYAAVNAQLLIYIMYHGAVRVQQQQYPFRLEPFGLDHLPLLLYTCFFTAVSKVLLF